MSGSRRSPSPVFLFLALAVLAALPAAAQPYGSWLQITSGNGYVTVPPSSDFNFTNAFTMEAWVAVRSVTNNCTTIIGKDYVSAYWVGICGTTLRSYIRGNASLFDGGTVNVDWNHIAVVWDGTNRIHYVNGEEVARRAESGPMTTSAAELRIGSDVAWNFSPSGSIDEVRLWNVARTRAQIRAGINVAYTTPQPGLVAQYHFDANASDASGGNHHGTLAGTAAYLNAPVTSNCTSSASALCLDDSRFLVTSRYVTTGGTSGNGTVVPGASANSGMFWFFGADNWEVLVKVLNGCGVNNRRWVFGAATTDQHYELIVTDVRSGATRRYFNYLGEKAPAITDTGAFAACP